MKKLLKFLAGLIVLMVVALVLACLFWLDPMVKKAVERVGTEALGVPVKVENVSIRPLSGTAHIEGLFVGNPKGFSHPSVLEVNDFQMNLNLASLMTDTIVIEELMIDQPSIAYELMRNTDNIKELQKNVEGFTAELDSADEAKEGEPEGPAKKVIIKRLSVTRANVIAKLSQLPAVSFRLPDVERTNIGGESEGASYAEAGNEVIDSIRGAIVEAISNGTHLAGEALKGAGEKAKGAGKAVEGAAKEAVKGIGDFFKRK